MISRPYWRTHSRSRRANLTLISDGRKRLTIKEREGHKRHLSLLLFANAADLAVPLPCNNHINEEEA
jgi:hypothetical protein